MKQVMNYVLSLLDECSDVPSHLVGTLPKDLQPKRLLEPLSEEHLNIVRKGMEEIFKKKKSKGETNKYFGKG